MCKRTTKNCVNSPKLVQEVFCVECPATISAQGLMTPLKADNKSIVQQSQQNNKSKFIT